MSDIKTLAIATDTELAELYGKFAVAQSEVNYIKTSIFIFANAEYDFVEYRKVYKQSIGSVIEGIEQDSVRGQELIATYKNKCEEVQIISLKINELNAIYRQHQWNRAYLVTNTNGHVHKSRGCSTCFDSTNYLWLVQYSGSVEEEIVSDAGQDACTVCYPSAPADVLNRPSVIVTADKIEKEARKVERAEAKRVRDAKKLASAPTVDGSELLVADGYKGRNGDFRLEELKTERTARIWYVDKSESLACYGQNKSEEEVAVIKESLEAILVALAGKHGVEVDAVRADLGKKVAKRVADIEKFRAELNRRNGS